MYRGWDHHMIRWWIQTSPLGPRLISTGKHVDLKEWRAEFLEGDVDRLDWPGGGGGTVISSQSSGYLGPRVSNM